MFIAIPFYLISKLYFLSAHAGLLIRVFLMKYWKEKYIITLVKGGRILFMLFTEESILAKDLANTNYTFYSVVLSL